MKEWEYNMTHTSSSNTRDPFLSYGRRNEVSMTQQKKLTIVFFGTSEFGAIILGSMVRAGYSPVLAVTQPDKPAGRKQLLTSPPVKIIAEKYQIPLFQPVRLDNSAIAELLRQEAGIFFLAAYGKILPKEVLEIPKYGALNVHPSLLPKYRGPSPVQSAILAGEKATGVTILLMDEELDHGPIVAHQEVAIGTFDALELKNRLAEVGAKLLVETIPQWVAGKISPREQDHSQVTFTKRFAKEDGRIDWNKEAEYKERQVRALYPWPGTFTKLKVKSDPFDKTQGHPERSRTDEKLKIIKILRANVIDGDPSKNPGETLLASGGKLAVQTGKGALLIEELQLEGGKPMHSREFLLGHKHVELF
jgi:methionyl-tRNA formyltransferase